MWKLVLALVFLSVMPITEQMAFAQGTDPAAKPCYCINRDGERVALGQLACLRVGGRQFMARCSRSLNLLTWRKVADGCLSSSIPSALHPLG